MLSNKHIRQLQTAVLYQKEGRLSEASKLCRRILHDVPDDFDCLCLSAALHARQDNFKSAADGFRRAARIKPDNLDVLYNLAVALSMAGNLDEAARSYEKVLEREPRHVNARNNYAACLLHTRHFAQALDQYNRLIALNPAHADAYNNRGMALQALKRAGEALADYDQAVALNPNFAEAYVNRGNVLVDLRRPDEAMTSYQQAIGLQPTFAAAYNNIGNIHFHRGRYREAIAAYDKGLALHSADSDARSMRLAAKMHLCDWRNFEHESSDFVSSVKSGSVASPFLALSVTSSLEDHFLCATKFNALRFPLSEEPVWRNEIYSHDRIRVAYVSGDFREHPIAYLMAGLFERHDRSRFEVTAISFSPDQDTEFVRRLGAAFEHFIDVRGESDQAVAELIRRREIDIAVDLVGYLESARPDIFARRAAPVQVNYIGFPGTMGAKYFDYIVADPTVVPIEDVEFYTEKVAWLPNAYLPTDARTVSTSTPPRSELNLPEGGFVFCCFNQSYKINPAIFDVWMRLLRQVEGSVLWLREYSEEAARNLRSEAQRRGVAPERLIFAARMPRAADHLARQRHADLFLDTQPYNAHTTASEALWVGLPVITCIGPSFAGRVASSLNFAVGMPELVTTSLPDYEALALKIANDPALCAQLKDKLLRNRATEPLFKTAEFTRQIEAAYERMWRNYQDGRPPENFAVTADVK